MTALETIVDGGKVGLQRWSLDRLDDLIDAIHASLDELRPWLPWVNPMPTRDQECKIVSEAIERFDAGVDFSYFIIEHETDAVVGCAGLHPKPDDVLEIGYWVRTDRHRRGYATEATRLLTSTALEHCPRVRRIQIRTDQANVASAAIPPKVGYTLHSRNRWDRDLSPGESGIELTWVIERPDTT
ncbi:MAG: GNAT family N-acetyltransferase [Microthrixaceae bacterium]